MISGFDSRRGIHDLEAKLTNDIRENNEWCDDHIYHVECELRRIDETPEQIDRSSRRYYE